MVNIPTIYDYGDDWGMVYCLPTFGYSHTVGFCSWSVRVDVECIPRKVKLWTGGGTNHQEVTRYHRVAPSGPRADTCHLGDHPDGGTVFECCLSWRWWLDAWYVLREYLIYWGWYITIIIIHCGNPVGFLTILDVGQTSWQCFRARPAHNGEAQDSFFGDFKVHRDQQSGPLRASRRVKVLWVWQTVHRLGPTRPDRVRFRKRRGAAEHWPVAKPPSMVGGAIGVTNGYNMV
jgi:hypothetical protein